MTKTVEEVAKELAAAHVAEDPNTTAVYFIDDEKSEVRLVEVSTSLADVGPGEVLPVRFQAQPANGIPYDSVIVLLSPAEWQSVDNGDLPLPKGWDRQKLKKAI